MVEKSILQSRLGLERNKCEKQVRQFGIMNISEYCFKRYNDIRLCAAHNSTACLSRGTSFRASCYSPKLETSHVSFYVSKIINTVRDETL